MRKRESLGILYVGVSLGHFDMLLQLGRGHIDLRGDMVESGKQILKELNSDLIRIP